MSDAATPYRPRCKNLYCKSMMVFGEGFENDPDYQAGMVDFWCERTFKANGPDGRGTSLPLCSDTTRSCYRAY